MSTKLYDEIPSLDLTDFTSGNADKKQTFVQALGEAYNNIGFVAIKNHGLTDELTEKLYATIQSFFGLSDDIKQQYEVPDLAGQRGYIGKGKEHAKGRTTGDLKDSTMLDKMLQMETQSKMNTQITFGPQNCQK